MTDPSHTPQPDRLPEVDPLDDDPALVDDAIDPAALAGLRAMLRDEPVDDDEIARERRIRAALAAAPVTSRSEPSHAPSVVPIPRRSTARPWLVAAAVLAVLGIGGYVVVSGAGSGSSNDSAEVATADQDTLASSTVPGAADSAASAAPEAAGAPTTTVGTTGSAADIAPPRVADLGQYVDLAALRAALGGAPVELRSAQADIEPTPDALPCVEQQLATGIDVVGVATVGGLRVVVVTAPTGTEVLDAATCAPAA